MTPSLCSVMAQYNHWMNVRLYEAAAKLPTDKLNEDNGAFFGSLFNTLSHIAVADLIWLNRFAQLEALGPLRSELAGFPSPASLTEQIAVSLAELADLRAKIDAVITELAGIVTEEHLSETVRYANTAGLPQAKNFGLLLLHFFNHQTHHRGQASTLLFQAGIDVGVTDLNALIPNGP